MVRKSIPPPPAPREDDYTSSSEEDSDDCSSDSLLGLDVFATVASSIPLTSSNEPLSLSVTSPRGRTGSASTTSSMSDTNTLLPQNEGTSTTRRSVHNNCERRRRQHIRQGFSTLQDRLPSGQNLKLSKMEILRASVDHIKFLQKRTASLEAEVASLKRNANITRQK